MKFIFRPEMGEEHRLVLWQHGSGKVTTISLLMLAVLLFISLFLTVVFTDLTLGLVAIFGIGILGLYWLSGRRPFPWK